MTIHIYVCINEILADLRSGEKVSATQLVPASKSTESVNSELSSMFPGMAFMHTMCDVGGFTTNRCLTLATYTAGREEENGRGERGGGGTK